MSNYPRDFLGYGQNPPDPKWPDGAKIAVQFVVNYEEGGENCILHGDAASEAFLSEIVGAQPWQGQRHWNMESLYEYGVRAGFWRLHRLFGEYQIRPTVYGVATALARGPEQVAAMQEARWEIASHGYKWIEYRDYTKADELQHIQKAIEIHEQVTGQKPKGWYTGRCSVNTVDLIAENGEFDYCSDSYADDLPYWYVKDGSKPLLIIPYTLDSNDMRFSIPGGFNYGEPFFQYLKDSFDTLYREGQQGCPKILNIGLHCRLVGRPGRIAALRKFIEYAQSHDQVWFAQRTEIARHWHQNHPHKTAALPSHMSEETFINTYGGIFEHSPWIAERAYKNGLTPANNSAIGLHSALTRAFRSADENEKLKVLKAHPDLAGKLAAAKQLTAQSTAEQASAGLDHLTDKERAQFTQLNKTYVEKFEFPFIVAVKGLSKAQILEQFEQRISNTKAQEFETACQQVEKIALLRLKDMMP